MGQIVRPVAGGAGPRCDNPEMLCWRRKRYEPLAPGQQASPWEQFFDVVALVVAMVVAMAVYTATLLYAVERDA